MADEPLKDYLVQYKQDILEKEALFTGFLEDLNTNPIYQDYFAKYHPDSVIQFKEAFARYKVQSLQLENHFKKKAEQQVHRYIDIAYRCLWEIQHFKLLQIESKWRSKQLDIEGIKYTYQFTIWHCHIEECMFIPPITQQEVDYYLQYLQQEQSTRKYDVLEPEYMHDLEIFDRLRTKVIDNDTLPPYVAYMLNLYGKSMFMIDDVRGKREDKYSDIAMIERQQKVKDTMNGPDYDARPCVFFSDEEHFKEVINKFGTHEMMDYHRVKDELMDINGGWSYFDDSIEILKEAGEDYPVDYHKDWQWAIINAAENYKKNNVIKAFKLAYNEYLFRLQSGIAFNKYDGWRPTDNLQWLETFSLENIKRGMELLGEEGEFELD